MLFCEIDVKPGERTLKAIRNYSEAFSYIRQQIVELIDIEHNMLLQTYIKTIRGNTGSVYRNTIADFIEKYLTDPCFPYTKKDIPSDNPNDYGESKYINNIDIDIAEDRIDIGEGRIHSDFVFKKNVKEFEDKVKFEYQGFELDNYKESDLSNIYITASDKAPHDYCFPKSAYPLLVLKTLEDSDRPMSQRDIELYIKDEYNVRIERKAIGRHLDMLIALDFDVKKGSKGYHMDF